MTSFGKKILSAFVDISSEENEVNVNQPEYQSPLPAVENHKVPEAGYSKFLQYFDKLFSEANLPGPDYYEFSKMIEAMNAIPDEKARFCAAFAGLNVQGLDKQKLLSTAADYLTLLDDDAANFNSTVDEALQEKIVSKQKQMEEKSRKIQELSGEISDLHNKISLLKAEISENQEKMEANTTGYRTEGQNMRNRILSNVEKIEQHIH
jgi:hypothetical protein